MWRLANVLALLLALCSHAASASNPVQSIDLSRKSNLLQADFLSAHAAYPTELEVLIPAESGEPVEATLRAYEPFRLPRVVFLDGERLDQDSMGGLKRYYRGHEKNQPSTFVFLIISESGEASLSLETSSGKFSGELEASGFRLTPIEASDAPALQRADPDFILPPELIPDRYDSAALGRSGPPAPESTESGSITIGSGQGWYGPYRIQVPQGQSYVGAVSRGPGSANVYVSDNPNPAAVWSDLEYCEYSACFVPEPTAKTYYLSVYRFADDYGELQVDFGFGSELQDGDLYIAKLAIELDDDLYAALGNVEAASDYVAQVYAYASLTYEREVKTQLQVSELVLYSNDPYEDATGGSARLREVREHWRRNKADTERTAVSHLALNVSGGVAYLDVLCSQTAGYSVSGVRVSPPSDPNNITWDGLVTAHELGHNFGSLHTHCYRGIAGNSSPVDACYGSESGSECWSGSRSHPGPDSLSGGAPGAQNGTIMSYCHLLSGGMSNVANTLGMGHPYGVAPERVPAVMSSRVGQFAAASSACVETTSTGAGTRYSVSPSASAGGAITPSSIQSVSEGGTISFTLTPDQDYSISGVTGTCPGSLSGSVYTAGPVISDCSVDAKFSREVMMPPTISQIDSGDGSLTAYFDKGSWAGTAQSYTLRCRQSGQRQAFAAEAGLSKVIPELESDTARTGTQSPKLAAFHKSITFQKEGLRCGTTQPPTRPEPANRLDETLSAQVEDCSLRNTNVRTEYDPDADNILTIPLHFHVIHKTDGTGYVSEKRILEQVRVLNEDFAGSANDSALETGIRFSLEAIHYVENDDWFHDAGATSASKFKAALAVDPSRNLNIYTNDAGGQGSLGYSTYPQFDNGVEDGVVLLHSVIGGRDNGYGIFDQGRTLVHEVGHYLGLLHTFEPAGRCGSGYKEADLVHDTPPQLSPDFGSSASYSCGGYSDVENFMNYSDDRTMRAFTSEQINRMRCSQMSYRPNAYSFNDEGNVFSTTGIRSPLSLNGLTNGASYSCTITANGAGSQNTTSRTFSATPRKPTVPAAPVIQRIDTADGEVNLVLSVPDSGGLAITQYTASCSDGISVWTGRSATPSVTIKGLSNDVEYACSASVANQLGASEMSATASRVVPRAEATGLPTWMLYQAYVVATEKMETDQYCGTFDPDLVECDPDENLDPWATESAGKDYTITDQLTRALPFTSTNTSSVQYGWLELDTSELPRQSDEDVFHIWFSEAPNGAPLSDSNCEAYLDQARGNFYWTQSTEYINDMCYLGQAKRTLYVNFETRCEPASYPGDCNDQQKQKSRRTYQFFAKKMTAN